MSIAVIRRHRFSIDDYHRMLEAGILREDDRVELIHGEIVTMVPIGSRHVMYVNRLTRLFARALGAGEAILSVQNPLHVTHDSEPRPDIALLKPTPDEYENRLPGPEDVFLVVEVAESSLQYDREVKALLYARAGIPELWIVDIASQVLEVHTEPGAHGYSLIRRCVGDQRLAPAALPTCAVSLPELFTSPPPETPRET